MTPFEQVRQFAGAFGLPTRDTPAPAGLGAGTGELALRRALLAEEVGELDDAIAATDLTGVADALADIVYIACGTADLLGIPFDAVFAEVHRANMSKLGPDGRPVFRADGKVLKGPDYRPPDVAGVLAAAFSRPEAAAVPSGTAGPSPGQAADPPSGRAPGPPRG